jgi:hypothetical protein
MENIILNKMKIAIKEHWENLLLFIVLLIIIFKYTDLYTLFLNNMEQSNCLNSNEATITPCKKLLGLSGELVFLFSFITLALLIFKKEKEIIIKMLFVYFSATTVLYTTGIAYTDIEGQKLQLKLNQEYHTAQQEIQLLDIYKNHQNDKNEKEKIFENNLQIKELELSITNREIYYKVQQEEAKLYLKYKVTASYAIISISYVFLIILLLQLKVSRLKIIGTLFVLLLIAYPNI